MGIKFQLELNLQQMALIRVAANIWQSRPMITKISNFVTNNDNESEYFFFNGIKKQMREWLITNIFEQVDSMKLPDVIKNDLLYVIKPVGENLLDYLKRINIRWKCFLKEQSFPGLTIYCKYIEFDCIGKVDEVKTFLNIYNANENVSLLFLFFEACTYCLEDVIHSIWNKCSEKIKSDIQFVISSSRLIIDKSDMHKIQQYWLQFVDNNQSKLPFEITVIDALGTCYKISNNVGFEYFMNKIKQDIKSRIIVPFAQKLFQHLFIGNMISRYEKQHIRILFYCLSQMIEDGENIFSILDREIIISLLIIEWPWKYLLLNLDYFDKETYYWMIKNIVETIVDDYKFYKKIVYTDLWMIPEIWKKCPDNLEKSIAEICWSLEKPMMFKLEAVILITSVIDDTDRVDKLRPEVCESFEKHCKKFIDRQKYEILDLYMKNILQNDEERKLFKALLLSKGICDRLLLSEQFENFNRFLNWRFDNDHVQITQFKKDFTADIVFIKLLCRVLKIHETYFEMPIRKLFLILEFDSTYQEQLKQNLIKNDRFKAHLRKCSNDDPKHFNHILSYFQFSSEEIVEIEKKHSNKCYSYIYS